MTDFWACRRVLVTGHTGFKGSWLTLWLTQMGAQVTGVALAPDTKPALFDQLGLEKQITHHICDIRDRDRLKPLIVAAEPEIAFHLAAQPLVRRSYREPVETWDTNVMGTIHVLEGLRALGAPCAAVFATTDKVYENREWTHAYRENDPLGGHDPYSASKAASEIAIASWRSAFLSSPDSQIAVASARAGNVIGGGDWSQDRLIPDFIRALGAGQELVLRNPGARRPWQHVLDPLSGYLLLGEKLRGALDTKDRVALSRLSSGFNFGPDVRSNRPVRDVVEEAFRSWPGTARHEQDPNTPHEAQELNLATEKAAHVLGWTPRWSFAQAIGATVAWYRDSAAGKEARTLCLAQIRDFAPGT